VQHIQVMRDACLSNTCFMFVLAVIFCEKRGEEKKDLEKKRKSSGKIEFGETEIMDPQR